MIDARPNIGETKEDFLNKFNLITEKNPAVIELINSLNLEWCGSQSLGEYLTTIEIKEGLKLKKIEKMTNAKNNLNRFKTEVEETKQTFLKLSEPGDYVTGFLIGKKEIKNTEGKFNTHFILSNEDGEFLLPANSKLVHKLNNLEKIKGDISQVNKVEVYIELIGIEKLEGGKTQKLFKVLTT